VQARVSLHRGDMRGPTFRLATIPFRPFQCRVNRGELVYYVTHPDGRQERSHLRGPDYLRDIVTAY